MSAALCPVHQQPWKLVPAGYSQTKQKAYNAFLACPVKGCKMRPENGTAPAPVQAVLPGVAPAPRPTSKDGRYSHALAFAASLFQGKGSEAVAEALELTKHVYESWPE